MILAFILFVGFLIFGLYFFNPLDSSRVLDSSLFYAVDAVYANVSSSVLTYSVILAASAPDSVSIPLSRESTSGQGIRVETIDGAPLLSRYSSGVLSFTRGPEDFAIVRFGEFPYHEDAVSNPVLLTPGEFNISSSEVKDILNEDTLMRLNTTYHQNYADLKKQFNLPGRVDFSFSVIFSPDDGIYATQPIPEGIDVVSKKERKEILRLDGTVAFADIITQVW